MRIAIVPIFIVLAAVALCSEPARAADRIAILVSSDDAPYKEAVAGFNDYLHKQGLHPDYEVISLGGDAAKAAAAVQNMKHGRFSLIFSLGSLATETALKDARDTPIIGGLVLRAEQLKSVSHATGVALEFPIEVQLDWIRRMLPHVRRIGVIYNQQENGKRVQAATLIAKKMGMQLDSQEVSSPQDMPAALERLARSADVLWGLADALTLSPPVAKTMLLFSFRNSIPLVGPSTAWVKAGAFAALAWDHRDIGVQCGEMAKQVLAGSAPETLPAATPRRVLYTLNLSTARQLKIDLSDELVQGAQQLY